MPIFSKQHLADLVQKEADAKNALAECKDKLDNMYASDDWNESKTAEYNRNSIRYNQLTNEYNFAKNEKEAYEVLEPQRAKAASTSAFVRFLRNGVDGLESWEREIYTKTDLKEAKGKSCFVIKGSTKSDDSSGREITDPTTRPNIVEALKQYGGVASMAYNFSTPTGANLVIPAQDDTNQRGAALPQGGNTTEGNFNDFASVTFGARTLTSKRIRITREMVTDGVVDVETYAQNKALRRMGRGWDYRQTVISTEAPATLAANAPPNGQLPADAQEISLERAASDSKITTKNSLSIGYEDLVNLVYSVEAGYRDGMEMGENGENAEMMGRIGFIVSDAAERSIRLLKDDSGRPLWQARNDGIAELGVGGGTLLGYPYVRSNVLANATNTLAANAKNQIFFGNFSYFGIRMVNTVEVFNFWDSKSAENNEIEIVGFSRKFARNLFDGPTPTSGNRWPGMPQIKFLTIKA